MLQAQGTELSVRNLTGCSALYLRKVRSTSSKRPPRASVSILMDLC